MSKKNQPKKTGGLLILLILLILAGIAAALLCRPQAGPVRPARPTAGKTEPTEPVQTVPTQTLPPVVETQPGISLDYGLQITDHGSYTGLYMEDGSNEIVSEVMMLVVQNNGEADIQLAELTALCGGETYRFKLTNLAVGKRAVLLDLDRKHAESGTPEAVELDSVALFQEPMELHEDVIEIGGLEGMLNVKNISDTDISGDIHIYYKYAAQDIYYGGITFRVRIQGGLKAGELRQIPAGHFDPKGCEIIQVTIYE